MTPRSILPNHSSTGLSHEEYVGGEVQMNLRMRFEELFDRRALVRREIVGDPVDILATRMINDDVAEEGDELR